MRREKLHNLHETAYFTVALIYFENRQNSERSNFDVAKKCFFRMRRTHVFSYSSSNVLFKKQTTPQDAA